MTAGNLLRGRRDSRRLLVGSRHRAKSSGSQRFLEGEHQVNEQRGDENQAIELVLAHAFSAGACEKKAAGSWHRMLRCGARVGGVALGRPFAGLECPVVQVQCSCHRTARACTLNRASDLREFATARESSHAHVFDPARSRALRPCTLFVRVSDVDIAEATGHFNSLAAVTTACATSAMRRLSFIAALLSNA